MSTTPAPMRIRADAFAQWTAHHGITAETAAALGEFREGFYHTTRFNELLAHSKVAPSAPTVYAEPTAAELAANFTGAVARWVSAGAPVVSRLSYEVRAATCAACPQWEAAARFGLGRCNAPGCGCTSLKRWLATEKCPLGKWPERTDL